MLLPGLSRIHSCNVRFKSHGRKTWHYDESQWKNAGPYFSVPARRKSHGQNTTQCLRGLRLRREVSNTGRKKNYQHSKFTSENKIFMSGSEWISWWLLLNKMLFCDKCHLEIVGRKIHGLFFSKHKNDLGSFARKPIYFLSLQLVRCKLPWAWDFFSRLF